MKKKLFFAAMGVVLVGALLYVAYGDYSKRIKGISKQEASSETDGAFADDTAVAEIEEADEENTIVLWYADETLTEFITSSCLSYQADTGIHVKPKLVSGVDYLEQINKASIYQGEEDENGNPYEQPDVYITTHDNLMRAYMSGLASEIIDENESVTDIYYPRVALSAVTCNDKLVAYPLSYETCFLLYNKTYMADLASAKVETDNDFAEGEAAQEAIDAGENPDGESKEDAKEESKNQKEEADEKEDADSEDETDSEAEEEELSDEGDPMGDEEIITSPEVLQQLSTMIPGTLNDIKAFAYNYEAPDQVEAVFKWDVSDIFYNYFFVGNYMNVGGENGDNNAEFNIFNQQAVDCLSAYQSMNTFFSIDAEESNYDDILQDFIDGKIVFTLATTDAISKIEQAKADGRFNYAYGVAVLPDVSKYLNSKGLSVTTCAAINGYSEKKDIANDFACYLCFRKGEDVYPKAGKVSCLYLSQYDIDEIYLLMREYENSIPLPKMMETSNFWVQLEIVFTQVWNGADPGQTLLDFSNAMAEQIDEITYHIPFQETFSGGGAQIFQ